VFPRHNMPTPMYEIGYAFPVTYFLEILRGIILRGAGWPDLAWWIGGLALNATVVFCLCYLRFSKKVG
jgi:drug efflux transport system permease protein/drug efflux transport system ATP-binding protein